MAGMPRRDRKESSFLLRHCGARFRCGRVLSQASRVSFPALHEERTGSSHEVARPLSPVYHVEGSHYRVTKSSARVPARRTSAEPGGGGGQSVPLAGQGGVANEQNRRAAAVCRTTCCPTATSVVRSGGGGACSAICLRQWRAQTDKRAVNVALMLPAVRQRISHPLLLCARSASIP
ncbi:hypothetical protein MRX96_038880 [Rhipicephalus microplus]